MGLSQDEIDRLMSASPPPGGPAADPKKSVLERLVILYTQAIENIVPVIVSTERVRVGSDTPEKGRLAGLVGSMPGDKVLFMFGVPALSDTPIIGYIAKPLALEMSQRMMGQEGAEEINEALLSALNEAFNNILGAYDSSLKEEFRVEVEHGDLKFLEGGGVEAIRQEAGISPDSESWHVPITTGIDDVTGLTGLIIPDACLDDLHAKHPSSVKVEAPVAAAAQTVSQPPPRVEAAPRQESTPQPIVTPAAQAVDTGIEVARFEELQPRVTSGEPRGIDLILDVPLSVTVELGRKTLSVKDILGLVPGSLVELEKLAGENVDLLVNGKLFARGEVVVIDENFGVRVSSIVTPKERIERLSG